MECHTQSCSSSISWENLNYRLIWTTHVDHVLKTVRKRFYILYQTKNFSFCDKSLVTGTPMEYPALVQHPVLTGQQPKQLERVQKGTYV